MKYVRNDFYLQEIGRSLMGTSSFLHIAGVYSIMRKLFIPPFLFPLVIQRANFFGQQRRPNREEAVPLSLSMTFL